MAPPAEVSIYENADCHSRDGRKNVVPPTRLIIHCDEKREEDGSEHRPTHQEHQDGATKQLLIREVERSLNHPYHENNGHDVSCDGRVPGSDSAEPIDERYVQCKFRQQSHRCGKDGEVLTVNPLRIAAATE